MTPQAKHCTLCVTPFEEIDEFGRSGSGWSLRPGSRHTALLPGVPVSVAPIWNSLFRILEPGMGPAISCAALPAGVFCRLFGVLAQLLRAAGIRIRTGIDGGGARRSLQTCRHMEITAQSASGVSAFSGDCLFPGTAN